MKCLKIKDLRNKIINDDCLNVMRRLPKNSIPLIVTSPPYNLRNTSGNWAKVNNNGRGKWTVNQYDCHDDAMPADEYIEWQRSFIKQALRALRDDGAMFYNHKWRVQRGLLQERHEITKGFPLRQIIIWNRAGGLNFNKTYFLPTYEVIYLFAKPKFRIKQEFIGLGDIWKIKQESNNPHPAPFPIELPKRCISATNAKLVLDPFAGSGTTALAAKELGRDFICIEKSKSYCELAAKRLKEQAKKPNTSPAKDKRKKIRHKNLVNS